MAMTSQDRLDEMLLTSLSNLAPDQWPGGDGFTKQDVLREYPSMAARRLVPGEDTLHRLHPDLAAELARFFAARSSRSVAETGAGGQTLASTEQHKG